MTVRRPLAIQLFTVRDYLAREPERVLLRIAAMGFVGVEVVSSIGSRTEERRGVDRVTRDAQRLRRRLDDAGLVVCAAHTPLPEGPYVDELLDEQELLGNRTMIVPSLRVLPGGAADDLERPETLKRTVGRFNEAASLARARGMRVGYHNHFWEWNGTIDGRTGWDVFWQMVDPSVIAEVDIYWAQLAGRDPAQVIAELGTRAELLHVKDGPLRIGEPMTPVGTGEVRVAAALSAGEHVRWHIVELDHCAGDVFEAVEQSARWLVEAGFSTDRGHALIGAATEP